MDQRLPVEAPHPSVVDTSSQHVVGWARVVVTEPPSLIRGSASLGTCALQREGAGLSVRQQALSLCVVADYTGVAG